MKRTKDEINQIIKKSKNILRSRNVKKTKDEIDQVIVKLKELKPNVPHHTFFVDDNHAAIDAQIKVFEDNMNSDDIYDRWPDDHHIREAALYALDWMISTKGNEDIIKDWEGIAR